MVHLFEWRWTDVAQECEKFLGPNGFSAVQISPPNEHAVIKNYPWWQRYQFVSYKLESRSGNRQEFVDMVQRCNKAGVAIYADVTLNHMAGSFGPDDSERVGYAGSKFAHYNYPGIYERSDFHYCQKQNDSSREIKSYKDAWEVQNCELVSLADLDTASEKVRSTLAAFLNDLISIGVRGFRIDAAKHVSPADTTAILAKVSSKPHIFQEFYNIPGEPFDVNQFLQNGDVIEGSFGYRLTAAFLRDKMITHVKDIEQGLIDSKRAITFVDNHDKQREINYLTYKQGNLYDMANIFMLAYPYGYPVIMSGYRFDLKDQGPPSDQNGNTKHIYIKGKFLCTEIGFSCEHRKRPIKNMISFREYTAGEKVIDWWTNDFNQFAFARGRKGFVAFNNENTTLQRKLSTHLLPGRYCDIISGDFDSKSKTCTGNIVDVNNEGVALIILPPHTSLAIYEKARMETQITLVGNLQKTLGDFSDWNPSSSKTRMEYLGSGLYHFKTFLPKGSYEYKFAIGGSWLENYGQNGTLSGKNIPLVVPEGQEIIFYFSDKTHKGTSSLDYKLQSNPPVLFLSDERMIKLVDHSFNNLFYTTVTLQDGNYNFVVQYQNNKYPLPPLKLNRIQDVSLYFDLSKLETSFDLHTLEEAQILHDSFNDLYRKPFHAIEENEAITIKLSVIPNKLKKVELFLVQENIQKRDKVEYTEYKTISMKKTAESDLREFWSATLTFPEKGVYGYKFLINGNEEYGDDQFPGGVGQLYKKDGRYFQITAYDKNFHPPEWLQQGIIYQIIPDRFYNGDSKNDYVKKYARGLDPIFHSQWNAIPSNGGPLDHDSFYCNDYYGGDLQGIISKLDYLQAMGVSIIYLNPIFNSGYNSKYDTGDYLSIDPMFGTNDEFARLASELQKRNMRLILDGIFNHVGDDSIYFDRYEKYPWVGAYEYWSKVYKKINDQKLSIEDAKKATTQELLSNGQRFHPSNWQNWFTIENNFISTPKRGVPRFQYEEWWGYDNLAVFNDQSELNNPEWRKYFLDGPDSVAQRWIRAGSAGWRLDVVAEMDTTFINKFRMAVKSQKTLSGDEPIILGEVIPDASHYLLGDKFDSVMNYRFLRAVIKDFLVRGKAEDAYQILTNVFQSYPPEALRATMNLLDSHDSMRAIYQLGGGIAKKHLVAIPGKNFDYELGKKRFKIALAFMIGLPGVPTIYYGDEVGLYGGEDPDNRRTYPWGREDVGLLAYTKKVLNFRKKHSEIFSRGDIKTLYAKGDVYIFKRSYKDSVFIFGLNRGDSIFEMTKVISGINLKKWCDIMPENNKQYLEFSVDQIPPASVRIIENCQHRPDTRVLHSGLFGND